MKVSWRLDAREIDAFATETRARMARAATRAVADAGADAHEGIRHDIVAAGLSRRFAAAQRLDVYPRSANSIDAAAVLRNRIPYSGLIAEGGRVAGAPLLWLPIDDNLPVRGGGLRWTPGAYARTAGPLFSFARRQGRTPLLGVMRGGRAVPVFFGLPAVTIRRHLDVEARVARAAAQLDRLFTQHMDNG